MAKLNKHQTRKRRHRSLRNRLSGTPSRPRLCVHASNKHVRAQLVDDSSGKTIVAASTLDKELRANGSRGNTAGGQAVGKLMAERALKQNYQSVVFDRGGFRYHGVVKAVAEAAREGGLNF